jgi:hypothetical protein
MRIEIGERSKILDGYDKTPFDSTGVAGSIWGKLDGVKRFDWIFAIGTETYEICALSIFFTDLPLPYFLANQKSIR